MEKKEEQNYKVDMGACGTIEMYNLDSAVSIVFNSIYTNQCKKADDAFYSDKMLILNCCINGRCDVFLGQNRYAIVKENHICLSTIMPEKDFYYPGRLYEGIQIFVRFHEGKSHLLEYLGINANKVIESFCEKNGLYINKMSEEIKEHILAIWEMRAKPDVPTLRFLVATIFHDLFRLPKRSENDTFYTKAQIAIVREAESMILNDLSKKYTAKEMAEHFRISESSFKSYIKGILGESYLTNFRNKRMEKAAELLRTTDFKVIEVANAVGYENQGKFAKVFAERFGVLPLEYKRMPMHIS
ncbi:MAG: AraC family transcriptional regulator [Eubacterium sp.]|nr:AraC family transcriptional regulator [Eubacterium sp.]